MNLLCMPSIYNKRNQIVAYPSMMTAPAAIKAINALIVQAQTEVHQQMPPDATVGFFENHLYEHLVGMMTANGFIIVNLDKLQKTKQWNEVR